MIDIKNLSFSYDGKTKTILNLNLNLNDKGVHFLCGENGCGKTTLLKILTGEFSGYEGEIRINNENIKNKTEKEMSFLISSLSQENIIEFPFMTEEVVKFFEHKTKKPYGASIFPDFQLNHYKKKFITEISGGEKQSALAARTVYPLTDIIVMDEPDLNLDIRHQLFIFKKLRKLKNKIIVIVSHNINLALSFSDYAHFLKDGKIYRSVKKDEITPDIINHIFGIKCVIQKNGGVLFGYEE